jgi:hypothetical protein
MIASARVGVLASSMTIGVGDVPNLDAERRLDHQLAAGLEIENAGALLGSIVASPRFNGSTARRSSA